jgi:hypothetical protein
MSGFSLYRRFTEQGTLSEAPNEFPDPRFALPSTVNWMRALALQVEAQSLNFTTASSFYAAVGKRSFTPQEENTIFEQLLFSLHQLSALEALRSCPCKSDVARVGIVAWYYGIYAAGSAMVAAQDGSFQDDHTGTANAWDRQFPATGKVMMPFSPRVSTLVEARYKAEIENLKRGHSFDLMNKPTNSTEAFGASVAYLSGSAAWWKWKTEENITASREFKALNVTNFRTKAARELRDSRLEGKSVSFLHQAFRYRGKANYREALFLGYGDYVETVLEDYLNDLTTVLRGFIAMSGSFACKRLGQQIWSEFLDDLDTHRSFQVSPKAIWV